MFEEKQTELPQVLVEMASAIGVAARKEQRGGRAG